MKKILSLIVILFLSTQVHAYDNTKILNPLINSYSYPTAQLNTKAMTDFLLTVCDLTEFDYKGYDINKIYRHVLYTHTKYKQLIDIAPRSLSVDNISYVSAQYIDSIMRDILGIEPIHPPFTSLTENGFCYRSEKYMYQGNFSADYKTDIKEIISALDLGQGVYYVIFSDTYTEDNKSEDEYSYAIVDTSTTPYRLLQLGMGKELLDNSTLSDYTAPAEDTQNSTQYNPLIPQLISLFILCIIVAIIVIILHKPKDDEIS